VQHFCFVEIFSQLMTQFCKTAGTQYIPPNALQKIKKLAFASLETGNRDNLHKLFIFSFLSFLSLAGF